MNINSNEVLRSGLKKQVRQIDYKIYLWSSERNVSKREIKEYARRVFDEAGYTDFKASDGWYRRWFGRWKKHSTVASKKTDNVNNTRLKPEHHQFKLQNNDECVSNSSNKLNNIDESSQSIDPLINNQNDISTIGINLNETVCLSTLLNNETSTEDCIQETNSLNNKVSKYNNKVSNKKKGERYLPHFKTEVVAYALKYSIKEAAYFYKVNKGTVSDWIRNSNQSPIEKIKNSKTDINPDKDFIKWLKTERQKGQALDKNILTNKIQELIQPFKKSEINKSSQWFFNYSKRFDKNSLEKTPNIMYPTAFKIELALLCETFSKNELSDVFKVDRKRIRDWFNSFSEGKLKDVKRKVDNYLTDENIDKEIWCWYDRQITKPTHKQIRRKGAELYTQAGYNGIKCSPGWFYRWCKRYGLPTSQHSKNEKHGVLLEWLLSEFDRNKNITYAMIKEKASEFFGPNLKPSTSWAIRFSKKYSKLLQRIPDYNTELPEVLENKIIKFRNDFINLSFEKSLFNYNLIAIDEMPLYFTSSDSVISKNLIRKSGFENCHASVIISCLGDGTLLPTALFLKTPFDEMALDNDSVFVIVQSNAINDNTTVFEWFTKMFRNVNYPAVILCDNFEPHIYLKQFYNQYLQENSIEIFQIPDGCNSKLQPILFDLAGKFKNEIESQWSKWYEDNIWSSANICNSAPGELDIYRWVKEAHAVLKDNMKEQIRESFIKAGYNLPTYDICN